MQNQKSDLQRNISILTVKISPLSYTSIISPLSYTLQKSLPWHKFSIILASPYTLQKYCRRLVRKIQNRISEIQTRHHENIAATRSFYFSRYDQAQDIPQNVWRLFRFVTPPRNPTVFTTRMRQIQHRIQKYNHISDGHLAYSRIWHKGFKNTVVFMTTSVFLTVRGLFCSVCQPSCNVA